MELSNLLEQNIKKVIKAVLLLTLCFEAFAYIKINFFPNTAFIDYDYAKIITHLVEMGDKKSIFLPQWDYITTGEFDCATLFALPIYMLTGNVRIAFGVANVINIALWAVVIWKLLDRVGARKETRLLAMVAIFTLYDFGMLAYTNMMFIFGGQYVYKALLPILFVYVLLGKKEKKASVLEKALLLIYFVLLFINSISSGIYVFLSGIIPVVICEIMYRLRKGTDDALKYRTVMIIATVAVAFIGNVICLIVGIRPNTGNMTYTTEYLEHFIAVFNDLIKLYNPFAYKGGRTVSPAGIAICCRWAIVFISFIGMIKIPRAFGISWNKSEKSKEIDDADRFEVMLISIFTWNFLLLFVTNSTARYHLIGAIPLMLVSMTVLEKWSDKYNQFVKNGVYALVAVFILVVNVVSFTKSLPEYFARYKDFYEFDMDYCGDLIEVLDEYEANNLFVLNGSQLCELMKVMDKDHIYEVYNTDLNTIVNYDYYITERDRSAFSDKNIFAIHEKDIDKMPTFIHENYVAIGKVDTYSLYYSDSNAFDGISLIANGFETIDLAITPGYVTEGIVDEKGYLHCDSSGIKLTSAIIKAPCSFEYELKYEAEDNHNTLEVYCNGELVSTNQLEAGSTNCVLSFDKKGKYKFVVTKESEGNLVIKEMVFRG